MHRSTPAKALFALLLIASAAPSDAEVYRWTDASGREHFSANPLEVPESQRPRAAATEDEDGGTLSSFGSSHTPKRSAPRAATRVRSMAAPPAAPDPASARESRIGGRSETSWRETARSHADAIAEAEASLEACHARDARNRMSSGLTPLGACDAKESAIENAQEAAASFEDLARSKGVPPGWLR